MYQGLSRLPYLDSTLDEYEGDNSKLLKDVFSAELKVINYRQVLIVTRGLSVDNNTTINITKLEQ